MNLNDNLVREVYDGEHHVPGEAQHVVAAVPVYDPAGHGHLHPRRGAEPPGRCPPARPAQRPPARRSPRQHGRGRGSLVEPRDSDRDKDQDRDKDRDAAGALPRPRRSAPAAPAANGRPPSWPPCQWSRGVLRQDGGARPLRRGKRVGRSAGVRIRRRAGRAMLRASLRQVSAVCPPAQERAAGPEERGGLAR